MLPRRAAPLAADARAGGMGRSPETPAGAMGVANAAGGRAQSLACLSLALPGLSSPSAPSLCGRLWVRAVVDLRLCDRHVQQARVGCAGPQSLMRHLPFRRQYGMY